MSDVNAIVYPLYIDTVYVWGMSIIFLILLSVSLYTIKSAQRKRDYIYSFIVIVGTVGGLLQLSPLLFHTTPEMTIMTDGVSFPKLGFLPWQEIDQITIGGSWLSRHTLLQILLKENSRWVPAGRSNFIVLESSKEGKKIIVPDELGITKGKLARILIKTVPEGMSLYKYE